MPDYSAIIALIQGPSPIQLQIRFNRCRPPTCGQTDFERSTISLPKVPATATNRGVDLREAGEHAELVVIWGGNPVNTQINVMQHAMAAKKRGAKLVVIDPYRTGTAEITGLPASAIVDFARLYGRTPKSFIRCHHGFSRSRNGAVNMHAVTCLPAVTGAWLNPGGGALNGHTGIYPPDRGLIEGLDAVGRSVRELDQSRLGPILVGEADALNGGPLVTA